MCELTRYNILASQALTQVSVYSFLPSLLMRKYLIFSNVPRPNNACYANLPNVNVVAVCTFLERNGHSMYLGLRPAGNMIFQADLKTARGVLAIDHCGRDMSSLRRETRALLHSH